MGNLIIRKNKFRWGLILGGILLAILCLSLISYLWLNGALSQPSEAPEAELVLNAQLEMPFQVLIPAYLPKNFIRQKTQVNIDKPAPGGEPMVELVYQTRRGEYLTIYEWLPEDRGNEQRKAAYCMCMCKSQQECDSVEMGISVDSLRVMARVSAPGLMTYEEARAILDTLGPAVNRQTYSSLSDVPVSYSAPPAVEIPINAEGIQEVTLVVTPDGYDPEHFAVQKDVPVILTFRQIGQVGCGNEVIFQWGEGKSATLTLASPGDSQTLQFTPRETGEFRFNCPHLIYRGVMTVQNKN